LTVISVVVIIRPGVEDRAAREQARAAAAVAASVPGRMAKFGYRPGRWANDVMTDSHWGGRQYAYCQSARQCNTPSGNASHPPVDIVGALAVIAYIWWAHGLHTICMSGLGNIGEDIFSARWAADLSSMAGDARSKVLLAMDDQLRLPVQSASGSDVQVVDVDGWTCGVPPVPAAGS
jgi:hypothetical protein